MKDPTSATSSCTILVKNKLVDFICEHLRCTCGGLLTSYNISDFGCVARFSWKCVTCQRQILFDSAEICGRTASINEKFILATLASRLSYQQTSWFFTFLDLTPPSKQQFYRKQRQYLMKIEDYASKLWASHRAEVRQRQTHLKRVGAGSVALDVAIDGRWTNPRGFNSEQCTVTITDLESNKILWRVHVQRKRNSATPFQQYSGSARSMEGWGAEQVFAMMKEEHFVIGSYVHDNDASMSKLIREHFPNAKEFQCLSHAAKNLVIHLRNLEERYPEAKNIATRGKKWLYTAANAARDKIGKQMEATIIEELEASIRQFVDHCRGIHDKCWHTMPYLKG